MVRDFHIPGESLVMVKGNVNTGIAGLSELGLAEDQIRVIPNLRHRDIRVNAWGAGEVPADVQWMIADMTIRMNLIHFDRDVLNICIREAMGGRAPVGTMARSGTRLGGGGARFAAGNHFISLNITSPQENLPYRFFFAYLVGQFAEFPLGVEASVIPLTWRVVPYTTDPYGGGFGLQDYQLYDNVLDN